MIRRPPRSTHCISSAASDVYKRQPVSIARVVGEDVGNYTITPSAAADVNYSVRFETAEFGITQARLTVTANAGQTKVYGATEPTLDYTFTGLQGTDTEASLDTPVSLSLIHI